MTRLERRRRAGPRNPLRALASALRLVLVTFLIVFARAFGAHPRIPDPMKRNQITQVETKR